jgi:phenylalanyl-tRNA synthetase alpha subunit
MAMMAMGVDDIRNLFASDLNQVRQSRIVLKD